jgi:hypothetical protein
MVYQPGLENGSFSLNGFSDDAEEGSRTVWLAAKQAAGTQVITLFPSGYATLGNPAALGLSRLANFSEGGGIADLVPLSLSAPADGAIDGNGIVLHTLTEETEADDGTSVDNAASSLNGGAGNLHLIDFDGDDITVKVQHSANNSTWADLLTFTQLTDVGSEQKVSAAGATVNRYLRASWAGTFNSATFALSFARR